METKKIFLYNNKEAKDEANEEAKKAIDVIGIFLYHGLVRTEIIDLLPSKKKTNFLPWIISSFE